MELEQLTDINELGRREYREAWAWVNFCLEGSPTAKQELQSYLSEQASGETPEPLSRRLQRKIPRLNDTAREHFSKLR